MYNIIDDEKVLNIPSIVSYVKSLQQEDGSFAMDKWGEIDTRFSFCSVATLALLGHLDAYGADEGEGSKIPKMTQMSFLHALILKPQQHNFCMCKSGDSFISLGVYVIQLWSQTKSRRQGKKSLEKQFR